MPFTPSRGVSKGRLAGASGLGTQSLCLPPAPLLLVVVGLSRARGWEGREGLRKKRFLGLPFPPLQLCLCRCAAGPSTESEQEVTVGNSCANWGGGGGPLCPGFPEGGARLTGGVVRSLCALAFPVGGSCADWQDGQALLCPGFPGSGSSCSDLPFL